MFSVMFRGIVGSGEVRPAGILGSGVPGTHSGEYYVITAFW